MILPLSSHLFGKEILIGYLEGRIDVSDTQVARVTPVEGADPPMWSVRLEPSTEAARSPVFPLHREKPEFGEAPPTSS